MQHKRATLDIPNVSLNQTLFQKLEESFILLRDDGLLGGTYVIISVHQNVMLMCLRNYIIILKYIVAGSVKLSM